MFTTQAKIMGRMRENEEAVVAVAAKNSIWGSYKKFRLKKFYEMS